ncbi:MAG: class I tRNA ligase family protein [Pseudonocardiaceae bacterium]
MARARGWGVPVPGDPDQVIYVWIDALDSCRTCPRSASGFSSAFRRTAVRPNPSSFQAQRYGGARAARVRRRLYPAWRQLLA